LPTEIGIRFLYTKYFYIFNKILPNCDGITSGSSSISVDVIVVVVAAVADVTKNFDSVFFIPFLVHLEC